MSKDNVLASITETAFDCPHCGAYTTQFWFNILANTTNKNATPFFPDSKIQKQISEIAEDDQEAVAGMKNWVNKMDTGLVFLEKNDGKYAYHDASNLYISECYNCNKIAIWVHKNLVFPNQKIGVAPNTDLPEPIIHDFEEARGIIDASPRGAAALLRLCVQKLCIHLGEKGKNINQDIKNLVTKGLNPLIQQSLDVVRVTGNHAVHPGTIELKDDRDTAINLLKLINSIADQMISHPKNVKELYSKIPPKELEAIEKRDNKTDDG